MPSAAPLSSTSEFTGSADTGAPVIGGGAPYGAASDLPIALPEANQWLQVWDSPSSPWSASDKLALWTVADSAAPAPARDLSLGNAATFAFTAASYKQMLSNLPAWRGAESSTLQSMAENMISSALLYRCGWLTANPASPSASPTSGFWVEKAAGATAATLYLRHGGSQVTQALASECSLTDGCWHSLTFDVRRSTGFISVSVYVDGMFAAEVNSTTLIPTDPLRLHIGAERIGSNGTLGVRRWSKFGLLR